MSLDELKALLKSHDWYYEYSDDHSVWLKGRAERDRIYKAVAELGAPGSELFTKARSLAIEGKINEL